MGATFFDTLTIIHRKMRALRAQRAGLALLAVLGWALALYLLFRR